ADRALLKAAALHPAGAVLVGSSAVTHPAKGTSRTLSRIGRSSLPRTGAPRRKLAGACALAPRRKLAGARPLGCHGRAGLSASRLLCAAGPSLTQAGSRSRDLRPIHRAAWYLYVGPSNGIGGQLRRPRRSANRSAGRANGSSADPAGGRPPCSRSNWRPVDIDVVVTAGIYVDRAAVPCRPSPAPQAADHGCSSRKHEAPPQRLTPRITFPR